MRRAVAFAAAMMACSLAAAGVTLEQAIEATCRISRGDGVGSGCVVDQSSTHYLVITNAHVVGHGESVQLTFWLRGREQQPVTGAIVKRVSRSSANQDVAFVAVPKSQIGEVAAVPFVAEGDQELSPAIYTVGCPRGGWPTLFAGRVIRDRSTTIDFQPPAVQGRSGSVLLGKTEDGYVVAGLITWQDPRGFGTAQSPATIRAAIGSQRYQRRETQQPCPDKYCLVPQPTQQRGADLQFGLFNLRPESRQHALPYVTPEQARDIADQQIDARISKLRADLSNEQRDNIRNAIGVSEAQVTRLNEIDAAVKQQAIEQAKQAEAAEEHSGLLSGLKDRIADKSPKVAAGIDVGTVIAGGLSTGGPIGAALALAGWFMRRRRDDKE